MNNLIDINKMSRYPPAFLRVLRNVLILIDYYKKNGYRITPDKILLFRQIASFSLTTEDDKLGINELVEKYSLRHLPDISIEEINIYLEVLAHSDEPEEYFEDVFFGETPLNIENKNMQPAPLLALCNLLTEDNKQLDPSNDCHDDRAPVASANGEFVESIEKILRGLGWDRYEKKN